MTAAANNLGGRRLEEKYLIENRIGVVALRGLYQRASAHRARSPSRYSRRAPCCWRSSDITRTHASVRSGAWNSYSANIASSIIKALANAARAARKNKRALFAAPLKQRGGIWA